MIKKRMAWVLITLKMLVIKQATDRQTNTACDRHECGV